MRTLALQTEIAIFLNRDLIARNPLFAHANDGVILSIVRALKGNMYLKGSFIAHKGELGEDMYFLVAGEACASLNDKILKKYAVGSYFGELCLLLADHPRSCDLVCLSHVETRELDRNSFENIINDYPEMKKMMIGTFFEYTILERTLKTNCAVYIITENLKKNPHMDYHLLRKCEASQSMTDIPTRISNLERKIDSIAAQMDLITKHVMK